MSVTPTSPPAALGDVLALALNRAMGTSPSSIDGLRHAVHTYTGHQKSRGIPIDDVMLALSSVLLAAEDEKTVEGEAHAFRDPELARQLRAWCGEAYSATSYSSRA